MIGAARHATRRFERHRSLGTGFEELDGHLAVVVLLVVAVLLGALGFSTLRSLTRRIAQANEAAARIASGNLQASELLGCVLISPGGINFTIFLPRMMIFLWM